jgi:hypothetical protein
MILEKINQFSEGKYTTDMPTAQIVTDYEEKLSDAAAVIEALSINQRFISTCMYILAVLSRLLLTTPCSEAGERPGIGL